VSVSESYAFVTSSNHRWARVRVRGLLRSASLASRLETAGIEAQQIHIDTGSVRLRLTPERDEAFWIGWLSAQVAAPNTDQGDRLPVLLPPSHSGLQRAKPPTAALVETSGAGSNTTHSTPIDRLLAELGGAQAIDAERGLGAADARARLARDGANEPH